MLFGLQMIIFINFIDCIFVCNILLVCGCVLIEGDINGLGSGVFYCVYHVVIDIAICESNLCLKTIVQVKLFDWIKRILLFVWVCLCLSMLNVGWDVDLCSNMMVYCLINFGLFINHNWKQDLSKLPQNMLNK